MKILIRIIFAFIFIFIIQSCFTGTHDKSEIESALNYYDHLILKTDADSISMLYTSDGSLGGIAVGRDSIKKFLSSFKNIKVISQKSVSDSVSMGQLSAYQSGRYSQKAVLENGDTVSMKGRFYTDWEWIKGEGWRIKKMTTAPAN